jgi:glutaredoxin-like protein
MASMLDEGIKSQIHEVFVELKHPVDIIFFGSETENCEYCKDTLELLKDVVAISDKLSLQSFELEDSPEIAQKYEVDKAPGIVLLYGGDPTNLGIRFAGIPAGHEFTSLINDIVFVSQRESGLAPETRKALSQLDKNVLLQVFVTPSCPYCPRAVILAHQLAMESPLIQAEMVEAMEFAELSDRFKVSGVPHTIINSGKGEVVGAVPEAHLIKEILQAVST